MGRRAGRARSACRIGGRGAAPARVLRRRSSTMGYAATGRAAAWYGPVTWNATPRLSFHASYKANPAINRWSGLVMPIMIGAAYASAMISARPTANESNPGRGGVPGAGSVEALTPAGTAVGEAAWARHSFSTSRAISEEPVTTTAVKARNFAR